MNFHFKKGDRVKVDPICVHTERNYSFDYYRKRALRGKECIIERVDPTDGNKIIISDFFFDRRDLELIAGQDDEKYEVAPITLDIEKLDCEVICPFMNTNASNVK